MSPHKPPKKARKPARGSQPRDVMRCHIYSGEEVRFELIIPDDIFHATIRKPTSCTLSTKSGDTRRAVLLFD